MSKAITLLLALASAFLSAPTAYAQDAAAGERKAAMCIGCHGIKGYQSSFPQVYKVPMISGQNAKYIVAALTEYKKGDRRHPTMRGIAGSLTEQDMADLGAFYEQHGASMIKTVAETPAVPPSPAVAELLTRGACASCHGANYSKPIDGSYPKLAGQHADYLFVALNSYAIGAQPQTGRSNPIMNAQVKQFSRAELKAMADYLGSLPGELRTVPQSKFR
ncbi:MAG TPA: c-type cytochrome [Rubrivivax sp.]|nr:c-type cytochrome [Rubrivivax sp.]